MLEYGLSGSATYSVELTGLDEMMQNIPNNDVNQISARNMRDIVYTLWLNGGGGAEFIYTQGPDPSEKSTIKVGGWEVNSNFFDVTLQNLFDTMFFPPVANEYSISGSGSFEFGFPSPGVNPTINVSVTLTQKNETLFTAATVTRTSTRTNPIWELTGLLPPKNPDRPTTKGTSLTTPYNATPVHQNFDTTWTLNVIEGTKALPAKSVKATWYFRRYWGWVDLSNLGPNFETFKASSTQLNDITNLISDNYIKNSAFGESIITQLSGADGKIEFTVPSGFKHLWFAWPNTDYGGTGVPNLFLDANNNELNFFRVLTTRSFTNQYNYVYPYTIFISNKAQGTIPITVSDTRAPGKG